MRVALLSGVYVEKDAISASLGAKLDALDADPAESHDVRVFVHGTDSRDPRVTVLPAVTELLVHPFFRTCDVVSYEFGITYGLFDSLYLASRRVPTVVTYHNLTPLHLVDDERVRSALQWSAVQRHALSLATHVVNDSASNYRDLLALDIPADRMSVLALPPGPSVGARAPRSAPSDGVELLFVGRLVRAKGIYDLLEAFRRLQGPVRLTVVGSPAFSDPVAIADLEAAAAEAPRRLRFVPGPSDEELGRLYAASHALVMPSYHEGYCVPVMEALSTGCHVVAYDNSNLPETLDGLGRLVPTGDVDALSEALQDLVLALTSAADPLVQVEGGTVRHSDWLRAAQDLVASRSAEAYAAGFLRTLHEVRRLGVTEPAA